MKNPDYALLIAPIDSLRRAILLGEQTATIREGHRDFRAGGRLMLGCPDVTWAVMADIVEVRHCTLGGITRGELAEAGFKNRGEVLEGLRRYYPKIASESPVTIVRWKNVRGALVDAARNS